MQYEQLYRRSIEAPEAFWAEEAKAIHWHRPPQQILDYSNPPFRRWFVGGETNLCYNAVDRHMAERADQLALVAISTETQVTREITYRELHREVNAFAAVLKTLDVARGDRVVIYMPNMAEAVFAMLACARIGAVHSVVFGGFAAHNLALRIDDAIRYFHGYCDLSDDTSVERMRLAIIERESRPVRAMTREERLEHIWSSTAELYRGYADFRWPHASRGRRTVHFFGGKLGSVPKLLDAMTDEEIAAKLPVHLRYLPDAAAA